MRKLMILAVCAVASATAAPTMVRATLVGPGGDKLSGACTFIPSSAFRSADGKLVLPATVEVQFAAGDLRVSLQPTDTGTPSGVTYRGTCVAPPQSVTGLDGRLHKSGGTWGPWTIQVPTSASPVPLDGLVPVPGSGAQVYALTVDGQGNLHVPGNVVANGIQLGAGGGGPGSGEGPLDFTFNTLTNTCDIVAPGVGSCTASSTAVSIAACTVTSATNATPIVIGCGAPHNLSDGAHVTITGVTGNTNANGTKYAKVGGYSSTTFALYSDFALTSPVAGSGVYASGGAVAQVYPGIVITHNFGRRLVWPEVMDANRIAAGSLIPASSTGINGWQSDVAGNVTTITLSGDMQGTGAISTGGPGQTGATGISGVSVTSTVELAGANCTYGGTKLVSSSGTTYVCNGAPGAAGSGSGDMLKATYDAANVGGQLLKDSGLDGLLKRTGPGLTDKAAAGVDYYAPGTAVNSADVPNPGPSAGGKVRSITCGAGKHIGAINTDSTVDCTNDTGSSTATFGAPYHLVELFPAPPSIIAASATLGMLGWSFSSSSMGIAAATGVNDTLGAGLVFTTTTAQNFVASIALNTLRTNWPTTTHVWSSVWDFTGPTVQTTAGLWIGVENGYEANAGVFLRYSTVAGDTNFMFCNGSNPTVTCLDSGVPADSAVHTLYIDHPNATTIHFKLDAGADFYIRNTAGTNDAHNLYGVTFYSGVNIYPNFAVKNYAADTTARSFNARRVEIIWN